MLDIPSISAIAAAIGVIIGVVFTALQLRDLVKTRQTDLVIRLYSTFGSQEFMEAYMKTLYLEFKDFKDYAEKYGPLPSSPAHISYTTVCLFFEGVGVLLHRKLIDIGLVDDLFSGPIKRMWEKVKPIVDGIRKARNYPQYLEWFEHLHNENAEKRANTYPKNNITTHNNPPFFLPLRADFAPYKQTPNQTPFHPQRPKQTLFSPPIRPPSRLRSEFIFLPQTPQSNIPANIPPLPV